MKKIYSLLALTIAFVSCSNNGFEEIVTEETAALQIETSVLTRTTRTGTEDDNDDNTTSSLVGPIMGTTLPEGAEIGVSVYNSGSVTNYMGLTNTRNLKWSLTEKGWSAKAFYLHQQEAVIYAYFPYTSEPSNEATLIAVAPGYTDYMYGKSTNLVNKNNTGAAIQMNHALSMISFTFVRENYPDTCALQSIVLNGVITNGTMNLHSGDITPLEVGTLGVQLYTTDGYEANNWTGVTIPEKSTATQAPNITIENRMPFHALVVPATGTDKLTATVTIDARPYTVNLNVNADNTWVKGNSYTYNMKLKGNALEISSVTVNQWVSGGSADIEI